MGSGGLLSDLAYAAADQVGGGLGQCANGAGKFDGIGNDIASIAAMHRGHRHHQRFGGFDVAAGDRLQGGDDRGGGDDGVGCLVRHGCVPAHAVDGDVQ